LVGNDYSYTRHGTITTGRSPELRFDGHEILLDAELIAPGIDAPDDFAGSMPRFSENNNQPILLKAFDILTYRNKSVTHNPLEERKAILTEGLTQIDSPYITIIPYIYTEGEALFDVMRENSMEGMVAKRLGTPYVAGSRSDNWSYHDVVIAKVTRGLLTVQLQSIDGDYLGIVTIGFTREIKQALLSRTPLLSPKLKRGVGRAGIN
jgi:DNA ligase-1